MNPPIQALARANGRLQAKAVQVNKKDRTHRDVQIGRIRLEVVFAAILFIDHPCQEDGPAVLSIARHQMIWVHRVGRQFRVLESPQGPHDHGLAVRGIDLKVTVQPQADAWHEVTEIRDHRQNARVQAEINLAALGSRVHLKDVLGVDLTLAPSPVLKPCGHADQIRLSALQPQMRHLLLFGKQLKSFVLMRPSTRNVPYF